MPSLMPSPSAPRNPHKGKLRGHAEQARELHAMLERAVRQSGPA